jgi:glycosyltransferase involved in cell wall biosynthesis
VSAATVRLSIVIPAYNEGSRIKPTIDELRLYLPTIVESWEVRVVDDGSTDGTAVIVEEVARMDPRVLLQREPHRGKGGAVRAGLLAATGELRFMCDADLSMPVAEIQRFLELVPVRCEIAIGSREGQGANRVGEPEHRHLMGRLFNQLVRVAAIEGLSDTQCGFKLFTARAVETIFPRLTIEGWAFDIEMLYLAKRAGLEVRELPIEWHYRERSQVSALRDSFRMARDVLKIRRNARRGLYD